MTGTLSSSQHLRQDLGPEFALAVEWAEAASTLRNQELKEDRYQGHPSVSCVLDLAREEHDRRWSEELEEPNEEFLVRRLGEEGTAWERRREEAQRDSDRMEEGEESELAHVDPGSSTELRVFYALCRGEVIIIIRNQTKLLSLQTTHPTTGVPGSTCRLTSLQDSYFLIMPLK